MRKSTSVLTSASKQFPVRRLEISEILDDRFAPMRIKAYREAHSRRGCERAIFATRKLLKSAQALFDHLAAPA
jgi:hypothetical protein